MGTCELEEKLKSKDRLLISILSSKGISNLIPRYDEEADILEVGNPEIHEWPKGIDIDGRIIFDLDCNRVLANFDLIVPRKLWKVSTELSLPDADTEGDLQFQESTAKIKSFSLPLKILANQDRKNIAIRFKHVKGVEIVVKLSKWCWAVVAENTLNGFFIRMPD